MKLSTIAAGAIGVTHILACANTATSPDAGPGDGGASDAPSDNGNDVTFADGPNCTVAPDAVYTLDKSEHIYRFDPPTKKFCDLGLLDCPATPTVTQGKTPFSMAIDRDTNAWVLYVSGEIFKVDLKNQLSCTKTSWVTPQSGDLDEMVEFGMGFSTDAPGGTTDSLFVMGLAFSSLPFNLDGGLSNLLNVELATIDTSIMTPTAIATEVGTNQQVAEMTGNGNAELWGFIPDYVTPRVVQINKTNGTFIKDFPEPALARTNPGYAFAHWGGDYWAFIYENNADTTTVYQIDPTTGALKTTTPNTGRLIVGAGVSTLAPIN